MFALATLAAASCIFLASSSLAYAQAPYKIVAIKSQEAQAYKRAIEGFVDVLEENNLREGTDWTLDEYGLSQVNEAIKKASDEPRALILTLGKEASVAVKDKVFGKPLLFSVVLNPADSGLMKNSGVAIDVPAELQLRTLKAIIPDAQRIGIIYNPAENQNKFEELKSVGEKLNLSILSEAITNPKEAPEAVRNLIPNIDALLLLPDSTVTNRGSLEYIFVRTFWNKKPVVGFAPYLAHAGAVFAFIIDYYDIGRQTGRLAINIISGRDISTIPIIFPRKVKLIINAGIAKKLEIDIPQYILKQASEVIE